MSCFVLDFAYIVWIKTTFIYLAKLQVKKLYSVWTEFYRLSQPKKQIDDPVHVRIRFQRIYWIEKKVELLKSMRKKATLTSTEKELVYEDTIRGLQDFAGYLRRFGRSVIVDEPADLKEKMIFSAQRTISRYEEILYPSKKENSTTNEF